MKLEGNLGVWMFMLNVSNVVVYVFREECSVGNIGVVINYIFRV